MRTNRKFRRLIAGLIGAVLLGVSLWGQRIETRNLVVSYPGGTELPVTLIFSESEMESSPPIVLIGHGFAGSEAIMRGFAYEFAHAGYIVGLWDFSGHGANPRKLEAHPLVGDPKEALNVILNLGLGDPERMAILGHSMGSGVAIEFAALHPDVDATIAVSPVKRAVTSEVPSNLLLLAGSLERSFARNAEQLLWEAGGPSNGWAEGKARKLMIFPGLEHVSILFSPAAHQAAHDWLDQVFGPQMAGVDYMDRRLIWYVMGVTGILLIAALLATFLPEEVPLDPPTRPFAWQIGALVGGILAATAFLSLVNAVNLNPDRLLGIRAGGSLLIWFGVAGVVGWLILGVRPPRPYGAALLGGLLAYAALWFGTGYLGQSVWLRWVLIPARLALWPLGAVLVLPWFLAVGESQKLSGRLRGIVWWLIHSLILTVGLFLAARSIPELGFLLLILPLLPAVLALVSLTTVSRLGGWAYALNGALYLSWLILAIFPLQ